MRPNSAQLQLRTFESLYRCVTWHCDYDKYCVRLNALKSRYLLHSDVRTAREDCQKQGLLQQAVMKEPGRTGFNIAPCSCSKEPTVATIFVVIGRFIQRDPHLVKTIQQLRRAGKKTFLLTNSLWRYTDRVMSYLVGENSM